MKTASNTAPSLLQNPGSTKNDLGEIRILAALEGENLAKTSNNNKSRIRPLLLSALLILTLILATAFIVFRGTTSLVASNGHTATTESTPGKSQPLPVITGQTSSTIVPNEPTATPATIVEDKGSGTPASTPNDNSPSAKAAHPLMQALEASTTAPAVPATAPSASVAKSSSPSVPRPVRDARPVSASGTVPSKETVRQVPGQKQVDSDVDLLAALMAHSKQLPADTAGSAPRPASVPGSSSASGSTPSQASANSTKQVVLRTQTLTTADLVRQCSELGWLEGWLCKRRICSDLWGKDQACSGIISSTNP